MIYDAKSNLLSLSRSARTKFFALRTLFFVEYNILFRSKNLTSSENGMMLNLSVSGMSSKMVVRASLTWVSLVPAIEPLTSIT